MSCNCKNNTANYLKLGEQLLGFSIYTEGESLIMKSSP